MTGKVLRTNGADPSIVHAADVLRRGGLVAFPTETVYGLGADGLSADAVSRIFAAKGRPAHNPVILHVLDVDAARAISTGLSDAALALAEEFWPGPLTLVVGRARSVPDLVTAGGPTVAIRAPAHPVARALLREFGGPIAAPSANRYQSVSPTAAEHVVKSLGDRVELVLDGGPCSSGIESTVVDVRGGVVHVLRPGPISPAMLRAVWPEVMSRDSAPRLRAAATGASLSPGQDARHYAPRATIHLVQGVDACVERANSLTHGGERAAAVVYETPSGTPLPRHFVLPATPEGFARSLFVTLHTLDDEGYGHIVIQHVPTDESWWAVADRLQRAATCPA